MPIYVYNKKITGAKFMSTTNIKKYQKLIILLSKYHSQIATKMLKCGAYSFSANDKIYVYYNGITDEY